MDRRPACTLAAGHRPQSLPRLACLVPLALFAVCAGKDFDARRDTALLMMLVDAGPRRAELLGMRLEDVNFEYDVVRVLGKGGRERACRSAGSPTWTRSGSASAGRSPSRGFAT